MYTYDQIISDLKKKIYKPVYFLMGDEAYYIDAITSYIEKNVLPEEEKSFNQTILYGRDIDLASLLNAARRFPMMSNHNVVIVKEAQVLKGIEGVAAGSTDPFLLYLENPAPSTILVINLRDKTLDKRKKIYKTLDKVGCLFESKKIYEDKVGGWITQYVKQRKYTIETKAAELMANHLGNDLAKVANEIDKLLLAEPEGSNITMKEIEENIGISKDFNVFELQSAIGKRNFQKAILIITHMAQNPKTKSIIPLISFLYSFFSKILLVHSVSDKSNTGIASVLGINPYFAKDYLEAARNFNRAKSSVIISVLREYDAKSKGIDYPTVDDGELMKEMVFKIFSV